MSAGEEVVVACCALAPQVGEAEANRAAAEAAIRAAAQDGAQVVVVPELAVSGYVFADLAEAESLAEELDGPTATGWARLAAELGIVVAGGLCERAPDGTLRNSAVLVDPTGLRAVYRKAHLWDRESLVFVPGDAPPPVVDTPHGRIALLVCYDLEFPEWVRLPALAGAELLCAPVNWPASRCPPGERPSEVVRAQAAAAVNRIWIAVAGRVGRERGVDWVGGSVVVDPDGYPVAGPAGAEETGTLLARCRLGDARDKRLGDRNDVHADRRLELYAPGAGDVPERSPEVGDVPEPSPAEVEAEVLRAADALVADFGAGRVEPYFARLAPDATFAFHTAPQRLGSRADYRALWEQWEQEDGFRVLGCRSSAREVQVLGPAAAVLAHDVATRIATHAGEEELAERETIVFARRDEGWLVVHEHLSAVPA